MSTIKLKTDLTTVKNLRQSGKRLAHVLQKVAKKVRPGITLRELDDYAYDLITKSKLGLADHDKAALLHFSPSGAPFPYPATMCISVNDTVAHGIPDDYKLRVGDIVTLDSCVDHKGMITDHAITIPVGEISKADQELLKITEGALKAGIQVAIPGNYINDISRTIENYILKEEEKLGRRFGIIKVLAGHGVGYKVHEEPLVPNFDDGVRGPKLVPGMVLAIEPMINLGTDDIYLDDNGYSFKTEDGKNSAHFEHTILITKTKPEILTVA